MSSSDGSDPTDSTSAYEHYITHVLATVLTRRVCHVPYRKI